MRTRVYVDGFSLFHGMLSKSAWKWLDVYSLFEHALAAPVDIEQVLFYTARIKASAADDPGAAARQQLYLRALAAFRPTRVTIREGFMQRNWKWLRLRRPRYGVDDATAEVALFCEKQTDVNLASDFVSDALRGRFEQAVICSNDSDLVGAVEVLKRDHPHLVVGLVIPAPTHLAINQRLSRTVDWYKLLKPAHLAAAQLPDHIPASAIRRPAEW